jgi:hypothetical protein
VLCTYWINTYLKLSDLIIYNAEKNFISKKFKQYAIIIGVSIKGVLVEVYNLINIIERYYSLVRCVYQIIATELSDLDKNMTLQMAFKAINNSAGPDGLVPILLVFEAYL